MRQAIRIMATQSSTTATTYPTTRRMAPEYGTRFARIQALWRQLARLPQSASHTPAYHALVTQIRAEVDAWDRDQQTAVHLAA